MSNLTKILESTVLNEESKQAILEAWETKITEAREEISTELREEFASRYEHDKALIVEATDKFIKDSIQEEFTEFAQDKKNLREARVAFEKQKAQFAESAKTFIKNALIEEIKEFKTERKQVNEGLLKMQEFVQKQLSEELSDFAIDKKELAEARVSFEKTKDKELKEVKQRFVETASKLSEKVIRESLKSELAQLKTDLQESKKKMFGSKLFEAFAAEFMNSHYNEGSQVKKLSKVLEQSKAEINQLKESLDSNKKLLTEAKQEVKKTQELKERSETMTKLLGPLSKNQRKVMQQLLESTATDKLQDGYNKYIKMVLKEDREDLSGREVLTETVSQKIAYDGNRQEIHHEQKDDDTIIRLKTLSGIRN